MIGAMMSITQNRRLRWLDEAERTSQVAIQISRVWKAEATIRCQWKSSRGHRLEVSVANHMKSEISTTCMDRI